MLARTAQTAAQRWAAAAACGSRGLAAAAEGGPTSNQYPPPDPSRLGTADLCDVYHPEAVDVVSQPKISIMQPLFKDYGGNIRFRGPAATVKCFEANPLVRAALEEQGKGRVLVVDGGGSMR
jgi:regulator of RNase E activity RraA